MKSKIKRILKNIKLHKTLRTISIIFASMFFISNYEIDKYRETYATLTIIFICIAIIEKQIIKKIENERKNKEIVIENPINIQTNTQTYILPYKKKLLLTKNEWSFYKNLKPVADELGYTVLAKIRVADLVEVTSKDRSEWQTYFNKVNKKHVDFVLAKPENLQIVLLIELDDNTHNEAQKQRDEFIETLYKQTGYKLLRTHGTGDLKEKIENILNPKPIIQTVE